MEGLLPYVQYIGMCNCEWYGLQTVTSEIVYRDHTVLVEDRV